MGDSAKSELEHAPPDAQVEENAMNNPERIDLIPQPPSEALKTYREMQGCMNHMRGKFGARVAMSMPEFQAAWRVMETIKNRHGGMPPTN